MGERKRVRAFIIALVITLSLIPHQGFSQQEQPAPPAQQQSPPGPDTEQMENRLKEIRGLLKASEASEREQTAAQLGVSPEQLQERDALYRNLEATYQRILTMSERRASLKKEEESLDKTLDADREELITEQPSYSLSIYDKYLNRLTEASHQEETAGNIMQFIKKALDDATTQVDHAGKEMRSVREKMESDKSGQQDLQLTWNYDKARLKEEAAFTNLHLRKLSQENASTELRISQSRTKIAQSHLEWIRSRLEPDQEDLNKHLKSVEDRRKEVQKRIAVLMKEQQAVENRWLEARREVERVREADERIKAEAAAYLMAREAWRETYQKVLEQSEMTVQLLNEEEKVWQRRHALLSPEADYSLLAPWEEEADSFVKRVESGMYVMQNYQTSMQAQVAALKSEILNDEMTSALKEHAESQRAALERSVERNSEFMTMIFGLRELEQRLIDEIHSIRGTVPVKEKFEGLGDKILNIWEYELWVVNDRSVTIRKVVVALLIFTIGIIIIRFLTQFLGQRLQSSKRFDQTAASAISKVIYYFALLFLLLFALRTVNIPLTVFTFAGGAIAIGLGFGAQNLLNNFISGFILMIERPVKIGDVIDVENTVGIIEEIGTRCTRIRTASNVHILVPNSSFLEKSIINWTLSDHEIRSQLTVGVVYGSDTRKVTKLLLDAVLEHGKIMKDPDPFVLFNDFGDNALIFDVYFWISIRRMMDRRMIESDVRFRIDELLREEGIVIAFPQRDIHLDTTKPLDLRIVKGTEDGKDI